MQEIFEAIKRSAIRISKAINEEDLGYSEKQNESGETQLKLDIKSDMIIEEEMTHCTQVAGLISEEKCDLCPLHEGAKYYVAYDPLDGSSLVDVNLSVGSIFAVYEKSTKGSSLVSSAYVVYGPRTELVIATDKVRLYVLQQGEFSFVKEIHLQEKGKINAPGGTQSCWLEHHKKMVDSLFDEGYRLRYSGGMVPDIHQILLKGGGLFSYPNAIDKPDGKLRTLFEVIPFSNIFEKAGGEAIDHNLNRLLDIEPEELHHTTPCFFGSKYEIERVREYYGN